MPIFEEGDILNYFHYEFFREIKKLGSGGYGRVILAETKNGKKKVAIKIVDVEKVETEQEAKLCK